MTQFKRLNKQQFIALFSLACNENIDNILLSRKKVGVGGGDFFEKFHYKITKFTQSHEPINKNYNELDCILTFFDKKCYDNITFPKDSEILFLLLRLTQRNYKPLNNIKKFTNYCIAFLGNELFCQMVLTYLEKNCASNKEHNNIFTHQNTDIIHPYFILETLDIIHRTHKNISKELLKIQITQLLSGRINDEANLTLYKKLKTIDKYIQTSSFASQLYKHQANNQKFIHNVEKYEKKCFYQKLNKQIEINSNIKTIKPKL